MGNESMFSIIIISYRKFDFIYQAIDSVLLQNYNNIELIISDDGSVDFPEHNIKRYIDKRKKNNIKNVIIHREKENCGTVKHLNNVKPYINGKYYMILAADDILYDSTVIEQFALGFDKAPMNCYIQMSQTGMYDYELNKLDYYYLIPNVRKVLEENNSLDLYNLVAYMPFLPTNSTCFRREFIELYGEFDEKYKLIEDSPMHLRISRQKWLIHYENFVGVKHRDGGISHGSINGISKSNYWFMCDLLRMRKEEKKYYHLLRPEVRSKVKCFVKSERLRLEPQIWEYEKKPKILNVIHHPAYYSIGILQRIADKGLNLLKMLSLVIIIICFNEPILNRFLNINLSLDNNMVLQFIILFTLLCYVICYIGRGLAKIECFPQDLAC